MALINTADAVYLGDQPADRIYKGADRVWPAWTPAELFANGEQGAWLTPGVNSFADAGGTIPFSGLGGAYGRINDRSPNGANATQTTAPARPVQPANMPFRLRSDFVDDALNVTTPADCEVWVNTPHGHYRSSLYAGDQRLPLNDATNIVAHQGLTTQQRETVASYFGTPERWGVYLCPSTTVSLNCRAVGSEPSAVITFVGANGVSVTKEWPRDNAFTSVELAADGLTSPVAVCPHEGYGARYFACFANQLTGSIPDLSANTALTFISCHTNQLTGSIPDPSNNNGLLELICHTNQLTGSIPDLSANTALVTFNCYNNQLVGWAGGSVSTTLREFRANDNLLPSSTVNGILAAFVAAGRTSADGVCILHLHGTGNAAPTGQGLTDKDTLIARGWTVLTN